MLWAVDVGNTRVSAGWMDDLKVVKRCETPTPELATIAGVRRWAKTLARIGGAEGFAVSSVVPRLDPLLREALSRGGAKPLWISPSLGLGLRLRVKNPSEVGADRIVNALAARTLYGAPCIVVDFGTATTFDVVDRHGDYRGGAILPGIRTAFRALHAYTAQLPDIEFKPAAAAIGRNTEEAMRSGVWFGAIGQVRELLLRIRKEMACVAPAVATGGFGQAFEETGIFHHIAPNLTLQGLALVWKRFHDA